MIASAKIEFLKGKNVIIHRRFEHTELIAGKFYRDIINLSKKSTFPPAYFLVTSV